MQDPASGNLFSGLKPVQTAGGPFGSTTTPVFGGVFGQPALAVSPISPPHPSFKRFTTEQSHVIPRKKENEYGRARPLLPHQYPPDDKRGRDSGRRCDNRGTQQRHQVATPILNRATGYLKIVNHQRGYGFITPSPKSDDVYFNISNVINGNRVLTRGDWVKYEVRPGTGKYVGKMEAFNVTFVQDK
jgi:cold shock CspA family protein